MKLAGQSLLEEWLHTPEQLEFMDEVSKDKRTMSRRYRQSKKGRRSEKKQVFVRGRRTSTEALLTLDGMVAGTCVEGSMTKEIFIEFLALDVVSSSTLLLSLS